MLYDAIRAGFLNVLKALAVNKAVLISASPKVAGNITANTNHTDNTSQSVATCAGRVAIKNTSGGSIVSGTLAYIGVLNSKVTANSIILVGVSTDSNSVAGNEYICSEIGANRVPGVSFSVFPHRETPVSSQALTSNDGFTLNYIIIN